VIEGCSFNTETNLENKGMGKYFLYYRNHKALLPSWGTRAPTTTTHPFEDKIDCQ